MESGWQIEVKSQENGRCCPYLFNNTKYVKEIPVCQRLLVRPSLEELFHRSKGLFKRERNAKIEEAIVKHGYGQKEVADHLDLHYSTISRLLNEKRKTARLKT